MMAGMDVDGPENADLRAYVQFNQQFRTFVIDSFVENMKLKDFHPSNTLRKVSSSFSLAASVQPRDSLAGSRALRNPHHPHPQKRYNTMSCSLFSSSSKEHDIT